MADQADFVIKNDCTTGSINVKRKLSNGTVDVDKNISTNEQDTVTISGTDTKLIITPPSGVSDLKDCWIKVRSDIDLDRMDSRTDTNWTMQIAPNELPPDSPETVNISIGEDG